MKKHLPSQPNLEQLKNQAKDLLKLHKSGDPDAIKRIKESHPHQSNAFESEIRTAKFSLSDAQFVVAREYGFPSWPKLNQHVEELTGVQRDVEELRQAIGQRDPKARQ